MSDKERNDSDKRPSDENEPQQKASAGARLSIALIGVAFLSSLICMFLTILVLVRI